MKQLDVMSYRRVNEAFRRRMVCRIGVDCGFFVEMDYMVNAMLYCLSHRVRFQLYSDDANFGTGTGWTEYFLPFCEEMHEPFHRHFNFHRTPSWPRILKLCRRQKSAGPIAWKLKSILKTMTGHLTAFLVYKEYVLIGQDVKLHLQQRYSIPELGIDSSYTEVYGLLARMVFRFNPSIQQKEDVTRIRLAIPSQYDGVHIRGGDKITETQLISGRRIMEVLSPESGTCVFILTDDYRQFQELQTAYPQLKLLTLCQADEEGYHHQEFCKLPPHNRKEAITRLLISVNLLLGCRSFVGSITTGPSVFLMKLRADDMRVRAVDCPRNKMVSSLLLTMDVRAAVSIRNLQQ